MTIRQAPTTRDHGGTLVELLVSIVLVGMVVVSTLVALSTGISATRTDRDHSNAHAWLQTAADRLYASGILNCGTTEPVTGLTPLQKYNQIVKGSHNPEGWPAENIEVVEIVHWNSKSDPLTNLRDEYWHATTCDGTSNLQRITIRVNDPDSASIIEEVQVIISG